MKIGVDMDEVLVELLDSFLEFYNLRFDKSFKKEDFKSYEFKDTLGETQEEIVKLVEEYDYRDGIRLVEGALESVRELSKEHELLVLTARHPMFKEKTERYLEKNFKGFFSDVLYTGEVFQKYGVRKADLCKKLGLDYIIEDNGVFSLECAEKGTCVFLLDKPWNQNNGEHEKIVRVNNWADILSKVKEMGGVKNAS